MGCETPASQAIEQAAIAANADEFIRELEQGYDTLIGERGVRLSGGQRQRLAIARALLAEPADSDSRRGDQQSRQRKRTADPSKPGSTDARAGPRFVIAHRLSTIMHADKIVVLEQGRIVETGTHSELMEQSGRYRQMVELQTEPREELARQPVIG